MKIRTFALTAVALSSAAFALAVTASRHERPSSLADMVEHMESKYPGLVVAIEYDVSGDKRPHYHVDMRFPASGLAAVDVDAATLAIASREPISLPEDAATLADAALLVTSYVPGQLLLAQFDSSVGSAPHYDVDVRLPQGATARLKVDPSTREITWRDPAIVRE